jgi:acyl dehydratase
MRFQEFEVGQVLRAGPRRVEESEIIAFASAYDPQWFHTDPQRAAASRWHGLIASGWHTCSIAMRMMCEGPLEQSDSIGSPGLSYLKWLAPVRPGDDLRIEATVLETRASATGRTGILRWQWRMLNQDDVVVLDLEATSLFELSKSVDRRPT